MIGLNLVILLIIFTILFSLQLYYNKSFTLKLVVITYLFIISSGIYFSLNTYKGWPSEQKINSGFMIISLIIEPTADSAGKIYVWIMPDETNTNWLNKIVSYEPKDKYTPRIFEFPYSDEAASEFNKANEAIRNGNYVHIDGEGKIDDGSEGNGVNGNEQEGNGNTPGHNTDSRKYDVPHLTIISPDQANRK